MAEKAVLGWLGCAAVLIAWGLDAAWRAVTSVEVLQVFEDAEPEPTPIYDGVAADQAALAGSGRRHLQLARRLGVRR